MGFAAVAVVLIGVDATFMAVGRHDKNVALFVTWFGVQALVCIVAGTFQGVRGRNWWEIVVVAPIASMLLAFIILAPSLTDTANLGLALGPLGFPVGAGSLKLMPSVALIGSETPAAVPEITVKTMCLSRCQALG
jgi:hypothetical protein